MSRGRGTRREGAMSVRSIELWRPRHDRAGAWRRWITCVAVVVVLAGTLLDAFALHLPSVFMLGVAVALLVWLAYRIGRQNPSRWARLRSRSGGEAGADGADSGVQGATSARAAVAFGGREPL